MAETQKLEPGKIFVGGLSWDTTKESLINYFSAYGEVSDGVIMVDSISKLPRGFGFVTFKDYNSVSSVIEVNEHYLDGKKIDPKEAITKDHHATSQMGKNSSIEKKVFVGGLPHGCTRDEISGFFSQHGLITEVDIKVDRNTNKPRGFAFIEYDSAKSAQEATQKQYVMFKEKKIEVKPAENRMSGNPQPASQGYTSQPYTGTQYPSTQTTNQFPYGSYYPYNYPQAQTAYPPPHATAQAAASYGQHPSSSYHSNGYQPSYNATPSYPSQSFSTGYTGHGYTPATAYQQTYPNTYATQSESAQVPSYGQSQTSASFYQNSTYSHNAYPSDSRYPQPPPNQRNW